VVRSKRAGGRSWLISTAIRAAIELAPLYDRLVTFKEKLGLIAALLPPP
jgi:hypothetical protein